MRRPDEDTSAALGRLRRNIDEVDAVLVKLLNQRARWALEVGEVKSGAGVAIYQPQRESEVLKKVQENNKGPLSEDAMRRLFERVIDESRRLERLSAEEESDE